MKKLPPTKEQIKVNRILFFCALLCGLIVFIILTINEAPTLKSAKSIKEANKAVDYYIKEWDGQYTDLCKKVRNDNLKGEFIILQDGVSSISNCGNKCINLSYDDQIEVSRYAINKLKSNSNLMFLYNSGKIECW